MHLFVFSARDYLYSYCLHLELGMVSRAVKLNSNRTAAGESLSSANATTADFPYAIAAAAALTQFH